MNAIIEKSDVKTSLFFWHETCMWRKVLYLNFKLFKFLLMKKTLLALFVGVSTMFSTDVNAQAVEEGNVLIDAYYGFPDLYKSTFKTAYANSGTAVDIKIGGIGPVGGRFEYLLTDKVGLGLDVVYNSAKLTWQDTGSEYNETTGNYDTKVYTYEASTAKVGAIVTFNFHFVDNDKLDLAGVLGAGYSNRNFKYTSTDPDYTGGSVSGLIPVGFKLGAVMRYFFTDNVGLNLGISLGQGGLLNGGLSVKF